MHIRSKFDGGKVINRSQSGSWEHRCMGAGLRQNMGMEWGPQAWRSMTNTSPNKVFTDVADLQLRSTKMTKRERQQMNQKRKDDEANICGLTTQLQLAVLIQDMTTVFHLNK